MKSGTDKRRDHLANERTFLSWLRTSIGIMAFGFVVARFAFLTGTVYLESKTQKYSAFMGIALVAVGTLLGALAFFRFKAEAERIELQIETPGPFRIMVLSAILVCLLGLLLMMYLMAAFS